MLSTRSSLKHEQMALTAQDPYPQHVTALVPSRRQKKRHRAGPDPVINPSKNKHGTHRSRPEAKRLLQPAISFLLEPFPDLSTFKTLSALCLKLGLPSIPVLISNKVTFYSGSKSGAQRTFA